MCRIFLVNLLQKYRSHIQHRLNYNITWNSRNKQKNIDMVQRVQNHVARLMMDHFYYMNYREIYLVKCLNLRTMRERMDFFLTTLMSKAIHGIAPNYVSDSITMNCDIHGYDNRGTDSMNVYILTLHKDMFIDISSDIWMANIAMICQILWTLQIWASLNEFTEFARV